VSLGRPFEDAELIGKTTRRTIYDTDCRPRPARAPRNEATPPRWPATSGWRSFAEPARQVRCGADGTQDPAVFQSLLDTPAGPARARSAPDYFATNVNK